MIKKSKEISYLLRHNPKGLKIDKNGWVVVVELLEKVQISFDELKEIVETNNKKRFRFNDNETKIRANQGHSIKVDIQLKKKIPPARLFHGTSKVLYDKIIRKGLLKMNRNHVHLSVDIQTATTVGLRHAKTHTDLHVFEINTIDMVRDGYDFFLSENGVWLIEHVPPKYL